MLVPWKPTLVAGVKTLMDLDLFRKWGQAGGGPKSGSDLAKLVDVDSVLISKMQLYSIKALQTELPIYEIQRDCSDTLPS